MKRTLQASIEPGRSKLVEVNLSFSEGDEEALVEPTSKQINVFLREDREPTREAKSLFQKGVDSFNRQKFDASIDLFNRAIQANQGLMPMPVCTREGRTVDRPQRGCHSQFQGGARPAPDRFRNESPAGRSPVQCGGNVDDIVRTLREITNKHRNFDYAHVVLGMFCSGGGIWSQPKNPCVEPS